MMKRFWIFIFFFTAGYIWAQDMPPLPPLPGQAQTTNANPNEAVPAPPVPSDQQATQGNGSSPALPPLPDQKNSQDNGGTPGLPPLPDQKTTQENTGTPPLPPVPGQPSTPATGTVNPPEAAPAANNPPLPSPDNSQAAAASTETAQEAAPAANPAPAPEIKPKKTHAHAIEPWKISKWRPIVIFGGWISAKGGNESSRLAWASQEVLNALVFKKYKVLDEKGRYDGVRAGYQWREITFSVPKSKLTVQTYLRQVGKKIWVRVGPDEPPPPAVYNLAQVKQMQKADLAALHLIQKKLGRRLAPRRIVSQWEAPFDYAKDEIKR